MEAAERQPPAQKQPHGGGTVEPIAAAGGAAAAATAVAPLPTYLPTCSLSPSLEQQHTTKRVTSQSSAEKSLPVSFTC